MRVGVGSGNPVKRAAVEGALERAAREAAGWEDVRVEAVVVDSGVAEQPRGHAETVSGAEHRARAALAAGEYDLGVGLEGGVARFGDGGRPGDGPRSRDGPQAGDGAREGAGGASGAGPPGLFLVMWAAATDGGRTARGAGPSVRLPESVAERVARGEELGPVVDDRLGRDVARREGAAGVLTGGVVDREEALRTAVAGALGPFLTDRY